MTESAHIDEGVVSEAIARLPPSGEPGDPSAILAAVLVAAARLFAADGVGLMLLDSQLALRYVGSSDLVAERLERLQEEIGEGPCVAAFVEDRPVESADLRADERWPTLAKRLRSDSIRAVLAVPTRVAQSPVGTLNVYSSRPYVWDASDRDALASFNAVVERVLGLAIASRRASLLVDQLEHALAHRVVVERAVGFVMAEARVPASVAFNRIRRRARSEQSRIAQIAERILMDQHEGSSDGQQ